MNGFEVLLRVLVPAANTPRQRTAFEGGSIRARHFAAVLLTCCTLLLALPHAARAAFNLGVSCSVAAGSQPYWVECADVNADGFPDLVVANYGASTVSVLLGSGTGAFGPKVDLPVGAGPVSVALADVNGDGKLDLVTANYTDGTVSVLLGNGTGGFAPKVDYATGGSPTGAVFADLNADGRPDIVTSNYFANTVSVLLNHGDGTYAAHADYATGAGPNWVEAGDVNGDGVPDLVVAAASINAVSVLPGTGSGTFGAHADFPTAGTPQTLYLGDLNQDGKLDIVTANAAGSVSVLLGNGAGGFGLHADYATAPNAITVAIGDVDDDGNPDIVTANAGNTISVLMGNGTGSFAPRTDYPVGSFPDCVTISDINGDGRPDLVTANINSNDLTVLLGNGAGVFGTRSDLALGHLESVALGDVNGDHSVDVVTGGLPGVSVLLGDGAGGLASAAGSPYASGAVPPAIAVGDLNGDGHPDLVAVNNAGNTALVLLGDGTGGFTAAAGSPYATGISPQAIAIGDLNGDGHPDLVVANSGDNTVTGLLGDGTGAFSGWHQHSPATVLSTPMSIAIGDLNGDGFPDVVTANSGAASVSVLFGDGSGSFGSGHHVLPSIPNDTTYATGSTPMSVAIGDLNGDGHLDLVTANFADNTVSLLLGNGAGGFAARKDFATGASPYSLALSDVNGDGHLDVMVADQAPIPATPYSPVSVLLGDGAGGLGPKVDIPVPMDPFSLALGDLDGDHQSDLVVAGYNGLSVLLALARTGTALAVAPTTAIQTRSITLTASVAAKGHRGHGPSTPTGTVQFFDGFTLLGSAPVDISGTASLTLPAPYSGSRTFTSAYRGDGGFFGSACAPVTKTVLPASVLGVPPAVAVAFALAYVAPNPARGTFATHFALPIAAHARLEVMDLAGRRVETHEVGALGAGSHSIIVGAQRRLPPGLYLVRLTQGTHVGTARVVVLE